MKSYGFVAYGGQTYKTVEIGTQTWMAENLNYNANGSACYGEGDRVHALQDGIYVHINLSASEIQNNCTKYGRLYNWATAMALSSSCNSTSCASQINAKHRGICPPGWHIPSQREWEVLEDFVDASYTNNVTGKRLKATSGWRDYKGESGNGQDTYGFAALPGGIHAIDFRLADEWGYWWSANEYSSTVYDIENYAYNRSIWYDKDKLNSTSVEKDNMYSVRCLQD
jgi:uncharacterized protein (TIGR02145 family)